MTQLKIITLPHPLLKTPASRVDAITDSIVRLGHDMQETMCSHERCVGIAAPQVSHGIRMVAIDISRNQKPHPHHGSMVLVNPVIIHREAPKIGREGCLSVPDFTGNVARAQNILVEAVDLDGKPLRFEAAGFEAVVLQHEIDHLDGILFLDRVASIKTDIFRRKNR